VHFHFLSPRSTVIALLGNICYRNRMMQEPADDNPLWRTLSSRVTTCCIYGLLMLAASVMLAGCIWTLPRGFDITDEAYSLLLAMYPQAFRVFVSAAHWITAPLWTLTGSLVAFRMAGLVVLLFCSLTLALGVVRASAKCGLPVTSQRIAGIAIAASTCAAALHLGVYGVMVFFTPSYNVLAASASYFALGFILLALDINSRWLLHTLYFFAGASIAIVFLCKFPAGIEVSALALFLIIVFGAGARQRTSATLITLTGIAVALLLITMSQMSPAEALRQFRIGVSLYGVAVQEPASARLMRNAGELVDDYSFTLTHFALPLACFLIAAFTRFRFLSGGGLFILAATLISGDYLLGDTRLLPVTSPLPGPALVATALRSATALFAILLCFLITTFPAWTRTRKAFLFSAMLVALPYFLSLGTSNPFPQQILVFLASWGALFGLLSHSREVTGYRRITALLLCAMFVSVTAAQMILSLFAPAYHQNHPMTEQTEPARIGPLGIVRTDKETRDFLKDITEAARKCAIAPGRPFLGLYDIPGVALVIQGVPVMTPWLSTEEQAAAWLKIAPSDAVHSAVIGLHLFTNGKLQQIAGILPTFPAGYRLCGTAIYPFDQKEIQLWVPQ
jgi:hypothetical protein